MTISLVRDKSIHSAGKAQLAFLSLFPELPDLLNASGAASRIFSHFKPGFYEDGQEAIAKGSGLRYFKKTARVIG